MRGPSGITTVGRWGLLLAGLLAVLAVGDAAAVLRTAAADGDDSGNAGVPVPDAPPRVADAESDAEAPRPLTPRDMERLIDQLGAPQFDRREAAYRQLVDAGDAAIPLLEAATRRANPEIRWRAQKALELCRWGITTQLGEVEEQLSRYLTSPAQARRVFLNQWGQRYGAELLPFLRKVCLRDVSREVRQTAFELVVLASQDADEALHELAQQITQNDVGAGWAWIALARFHLQANRVNEAIPCLEQVMRMDPTNYDAHAMLAQVHESRGEREVAARYHRLARDLGRTNDARLRHAQALADILLELGRIAEAQRALEWLLESGNRTPSTVLTLLDFYFKHEMLDQAEVLTEQALADMRGAQGQAQYLLQLLQLLIVNWYDRGEYARLAAYSSELLNEVDRMIANRDLYMPRSALVVPMVAHAWALRAAGERDRAADALRRSGEFLGADSVRAIMPALKLARTWRDFASRDALSERIITLSPINGHLLLANMALAEQRDRETARNHLIRVYDEMLRDASGFELETLMRLLRGWDAVGDDDQVQTLLDRVLEHADFDSQFPQRGRQIALQMVRASTEMVLIEAWARNTGATRESALINRLIHHGQLEEALELARKVNEPYAAVGVARLLVALRRAEEAAAHLQEMLERSPNVSVLHELARVRFEELGEFEAAMALLDNPPVDIRDTAADALRIEYLYRLGRFDAAAEEAAAFIEEAGRTGSNSLSIQLLAAQAEVARGRFAEARRHARQVLDNWETARRESRFVITLQAEVLHAARILCDLGWPQVVLDLYAPVTGDNVLRPRDQLHLKSPANSPVQLFSSPRASTTLDPAERAQQVLACAYALESLGRHAEALAAYLLAWRVGVLDYQAEWTAERIAALATPETLQAVCKALEDELVPRVGRRLRDGGAPERIRHTRVTQLRMLAHARALHGDLAGAAAILGFIVDHALRNGLPTIEQLGAEPNRDVRDYGLTRSVDVGVELVQVLLRPDRVAGLTAERTAAIAPSADEQRQRAQAALGWVERLLAVWPNDLRLHALRPVAAEAAGEPEHAGAQVSRQRLVAADPLDMWDLYTAAFHFLMHRWPEVSEPLWRQVLAINAPDLHVQSNAYEYLGRLLDRDDNDDERRAEAVRLFHESSARIAMQGWSLDEDGYERLTYHARAMRLQTAQALTAGNAEAALTAARRASVYAPHHAESRLQAARLLVEQGRLEEAQQWLQPLHIHVTLRLRAVPGDSQALALRRTLDRVPGIVLPDVPPVPVEGTNEGEADADAEADAETEDEASPGDAADAAGSDSADRE